MDMSFEVHSTNGQSLKLIAMNVIRNSKRYIKFIKRWFFEPKMVDFFVVVVLMLSAVTNNTLM